MSNNSTDITVVCQIPMLEIEIGKNSAGEYFSRKFSSAGGAITCSQWLPIQKQAAEAALAMAGPHGSGGGSSA